MPTTIAATLPITREIKYNTRTTTQNNVVRCYNMKKTEGDETNNDLCRLVWKKIPQRKRQSELMIDGAFQTLREERIL